MTVPYLTRPLVLETPARVPDSAGGWTQTWEALGTLWADMRAGSGRERTADLTSRSQMTYRITVRAAPEGAPSRPRPDQRFREGERAYQILAVADGDPARRFLVCYCQEEVLS